MRAIADKADRLIALHVPQGHDTCATVSAVDEQQDSDLVAATGGARRKKKLPPPQRPQQQQGGSGQRGGPPRRQAAAQAAVPRTSMWFYHARFGERAKYCEEGCLWPEN
jgi:hypothetical protein